MAAFNTSDERTPGLGKHRTAIVQVPLLHIVDVLADTIKKSRERRVGLLATRFTMEHSFTKSGCNTSMELKCSFPRRHRGSWYMTSFTRNCVTDSFGRTRGRSFKR